MDKTSIIINYKAPEEFEMIARELEIWKEYINRGKKNMKKIILKNGKELIILS